MFLLCFECLYTIDLYNYGNLCSVCFSLSCKAFSDSESAVLLLLFAVCKFWKLFATSGTVTRFMINYHNINDRASALTISSSALGGTCCEGRGSHPGHQDALAAPSASDAQCRHPVCLWTQPVDTNNSKHWNARLNTACWHHNICCNIGLHTTVSGTKGVKLRWLQTI